MSDQVIGTYRVIDTLGKGGMGVVYLAENVDTRQMVALKTIKHCSERLLQSIRREIYALSRLQHPGIVGIVDQGFDDGIPWYAMDLINGMTLRQWAGRLEKRERPTIGVAPNTESISPADGEICAQSTSDGDVSRGQSTQQTPDRWWTIELHERTTVLAAMRTDALPYPKTDRPERRGTRDIQPCPDGSIRTAITMCRRICEPLAYLHGEGLVHRDLKPENILVRTDDRPVIMDFGLVLHVGGPAGRETFSLIHGLSGTVAYISPEQIRGEVVDARSDLYALGCILYELLVGFPPFSGNSLEQILHGHLGTNPPPPSHFNPHVPPELDTLVLKLLHKNPADRFGYARDVSLALDRLGAEDSPYDRGPEPRPYLYPTAFIGRLAELARLKRHLRDIGLKRGSVVLVGGECGSGKTRLVMELAHAAAEEGYQVLGGDCPPERSKPLGAFRKPLQAFADWCREQGPEFTRTVLGARGTVIAEYEPELATLPGLEVYPRPAELSDSAMRLRLFRALADTLYHAAEQRPMMIVIDDLQWADELSIQFLSFLNGTSQLKQEPLLLVATCRTEEMTRAISRLIEQEQVPVIHLDRLTEAEVAGVVGSRLALTSPAGALVRFLDRHCEGNPYFVSEYLRQVLEKNLISRDESGVWNVATSVESGTIENQLDQWPVPGSLMDLILGHVDSFDADTQRFLEAAAITGSEATLAVICHVTGLSDRQAIAALSLLIRQNILVESIAGSITFLNNKVREVTLHRIDGDKKRSLHLATAGAIEGLPPEEKDRLASELAGHYDEAGKIDAAIHWHQKAGFDAYRHHAWEQAIDHLSRTLELLPLDADRLRYQPLLARAKIYSIRATPSAEDEDLRALEAIVERLDDPAARAEIAVRRLIFQVNTDDFATAIETAKRLVETTQCLGLTLPLAQAELFWGRALNQIGRVKEALRHHEKALVLASRGEDQHLIADCLRNISIDYVDLSDARAAKNHLEKAVEIRRRIGDKRGEAQDLNTLGSVTRMMGDREKAREYFNQSITIKHAIDDALGEAETLYNLATSYYMAGDEETARHYCTRSFAISRNIDDRRFRAFLLTYLALILEKLQSPGNASPADLEQARLYYQEAYTLRVTIGQRAMALDSLAGLARVALHQQRLDDARDISDRILAMIDEHGIDGIGDIILIYYTIFLIMEANGDHARADAILERSWNLIMEVAGDLSDDPHNPDSHVHPWYQHEVIKLWRQRHPEREH